MPVTDPKAGRVFIWGISAFLFLSTAAGGACLALYMLMLETPTTSWLPIAGVTLVCLPWLFWLFTFLYRIFSRAFGFRLGMNCGGSNENSNDEPSAAVVAEDDHECPAGNNNGERRVQFEAAVTVHENDGDGYRDHGGDWQGMDNQDRNKHSTLSSSSNSSFMSHESEMRDLIIRKYGENTSEDSVTPNIQAIKEGLDLLKKTIHDFEYADKISEIDLQDLLELIKKQVDFPYLADKLQNIFRSANDCDLCEEVKEGNDLVRKIQDV